MSNSLRDYAVSEKAVRTTTPQRQRTPGRTDEVENSAGGYVFKASDKSRLERFLILGTDGGTYYVGERDLTKQNVDFVRKMIATDESAVLSTVVDVSSNGRAVRNSPALFVLALVFTEGKDKAAARAALPKVARTSTHLFEFADYINNLGGWGRAKRGAVADWMLEKGDSLAYQAVKYRQRNGWTMRDCMRLSHVRGVDPRIGRFILNGDVTEDSPDIIRGFAAMQQAGSVKEAVSTLNDYKNLPWEAIPTQFLNEVDVWKTLFDNGQLQGQALVRNITRLAKLDAFKDMEFAAKYAARLTDEAMLARTRLHPINLLNASVVYNKGQVSRAGFGLWNSFERNKSWTTESVIADALDEAFHKSFKTIEPAGKRTMLAIDVSGSMSQKANGLDLSCAQVSAAMAMTVARTEPAHIIRGFTTAVRFGYRGSAQLTDLGITARMGLSTAMGEVSKRNFGGTDCAQPMLWALENDVEVDTFVVITDNETWAGNIKPTQALKKYRDKTGIPARLAVLGVASTGFTIADPLDRGTLDMVGFDASAPKVLADFSAGRI